MDHELSQLQKEPELPVSGIDYKMPRAKNEDIGERMDTDEDEDGDLEMMEDEDDMYDDDNGDAPCHLHSVADGMPLRCDDDTMALSCVDLVDGCYHTTPSSEVYARGDVVVGWAVVRRLLQRVGMRWGH